MKILEFIKVASKEEIPKGKMISVNVNDKTILLANIAGKVYAIDNKCTHRSCKLSSGKLEGENVVCPCHKSVFSIKTGVVINGPAKIPEKTYEVKEENSELQIKI